MIYSQMFLHIKFPLTLLKELFSSLTTAVEMTGGKKVQSDAKYYVCSCGLIRPFGLFSAPPLRLSHDTVVSLSWRPHTCPT